MMKAVEYHKPPKWVALYVERWLKAPSQADGEEEKERKEGTPQGGVISPLLANLFLHYGFDKWMEREHEGVPFERYADDLVVHCRSQEEAEKIREAIERRLLDCKLEAHPEKTKIVYCRDGNRKGTYERKEFDFLGFTFRPRMARNKYGAYFLSFGPAISRKAKKAIKAEIRSWKLYRRVSQEIEDVARISNLKLRGWEAYYGKFRRSELYEVYHMVQLILVKWVRNKYKRVKRSWRGAASLLRKIAKSRPDVFDHWKRGWYTNG